MFFAGADHFSPCAETGHGEAPISVLGQVRPFLCRCTGSWKTSEAVFWRLSKQNDRSHAGCPEVFLGLKFDISVARDQVSSCSDPDGTNPEEGRAHHPLPPRGPQKKGVTSDRRNVRCRRKPTSTAPGLHSASARLAHRWRRLG